MAECTISELRLRIEVDFRELPGEAVFQNGPAGTPDLTNPPKTSPLNDTVSKRHSTSYPSF